MTKLIIEVGDRVKVTNLDSCESIIGIVGEKSEKNTGDWSGEYIKVYDPVTNEHRCTILLFSVTVDKKQEKVMITGSSHGDISMVEIELVLL